MLRSFKPCGFLAVLACSTFIFGQSQPPQPGVTLHTSTRLVIVDVVVTDSHKNPAHNLTASDFTLLEKNVPQQIRNFEEHTAPSAADMAKFGQLPSLPKGIFTNYTPVPPGGVVNILLLDTLNTPMKDQAYVRYQIQQYLKHAKPGTPVAIFGLTTRLTLLQGFTSDPEVLKAFVDKKNPQASPLLGDAASGGDRDGLADSMRSFGNAPNMADATANMEQFDAVMQSFKVQMRTQYTLDAMNQLARYLSGIPGRKNLIWFSGAFPLNVMPDGLLSDPFAAVASSEAEFRDTTNLLTLSRVAVYPVDARGLMTSPVFDASVRGSKYSMNQGAFAAANAKFMQQTAEDHMTMAQLAQGTGGKAFYNTNGLSQAVEEAINSGSNYYTITYSPTNMKWDGGFRKIEIRVNRPGLTLAYRRGYFAVPPGERPGKAIDPATVAANAPFNRDAMRAAMMRGGPDPTEIIFKARVLPVTAAPEEQLAPENLLNPKIKTKGPFVRYAIDIAADPRVMLTEAPEDFHQGAAQFLTYLYDQDGNVINLVDNRTRANLSPASYAQSLRVGLHWHQEISVPAKGNYVLRIGIHDLTGDRVGAIEVPIAAVRNLPPLDAAAAASPSPGAGH